MQGTRKGIYKRRNKIVKKIIYQTVRYHFFLFISVKSLLKKAKKKKKNRKIGRRPKQTFLQRRYTGGQ